MSVRYKFPCKTQIALLNCLLISLSILPPAISANPDEPAFLHDVHEAMVKDNWQECDALSELYLRKHKTDAMGHAVKAYALLQQGKNKDAIPHFTAAIKGGVTALPISLADSHANNLWAWRGYSLMCVGKFPDGIKDLEKSLDLKPRSCLDILNQRIDCANVGAAYKQLGEKEKFVSYESAADLMKKQYHHVFYPPMKSPADAKYNAANLEGEFKKDPKSPLLAAKLGALQVYLKNWNEAIKYLDKSIAAEPYLMPSHLLRAKALKKLNRAAESNKEIALVKASGKKASGVNVWTVDQKELAEVVHQ